MKAWFSCSLAAVALVVVGCGQHQATENKRSRFEAEEKARKEIETANDVITRRNQKLGRKPPTLESASPTPTPNS